MPHPMADTPLPNTCLTSSPSPAMSGPSSWTSNPGEVARGIVLRGLIRLREGLEPASESEPRAVKQWRTHLARPRGLSIPPPVPASTRGPAPYLPNLTPVPSWLCPHCMAKDRLQRWTPASSPQVGPDAPTPEEVQRECVKNTMMHVWEEETCVSYGSGLLMWHVFCDDKGIPETRRAPAEQPLLSAFMAHLVAAYSGKTITSYLNGVQAWHLLHSLPWILQKQEMDLMLCATDKLTPTTSKRKKHCPYTPKFISVI